MMPVAADLIRLPYSPGPGDSGLMLVPPADLIVRPRRRRAAAIAACALAFTIAAVVTAVVTRGHTKSASAAPIPTVQAPSP